MPPKATQPNETEDRIEVRDIRERGWFWADNKLVDVYLPTIGVTAFAVYMLLAKYTDAKTGKCYPSQTLIAEKLGVSRKRVRDAINTLIKHKLISKRKRRKSFVYALLKIKAQEADKGQVQKVDL